MSVRKIDGLSRRGVLERVGAVVAGNARAQGADPRVQLVPRADLVNVLEYEEQARRAIDAAAFARLAGGDRSAFDRITLRPHMMVSTRGLDMGLTLFGHAHHSPIIAGPIASSALADPSRDVEILRGAMIAGATVIAAGATAARAEIRQMKTPVWCQVFAADASAADEVKRAVDAGCRAACVTIGVASSARGVRAAAPDGRQWRAVEAAAATAGVPVIVKGVTSAAAAKLAVQHGAGGLVFSNYGGLIERAAGASIVDLPAVVDAVQGAVPVLMDGGFQRGTDILKALALGASAVLVARPVAWGLSAYGAEGVQGVLEMLQTELARYMAMCGKPSLQAIDRAVVKIHAR